MPTAAAAVGATALTIEALAGQPTNTLSSLLAGLVLLYSVGRYTDRLTRLVAVTVFAAAALGVHNAAGGPTPASTPDEAGHGLVGMRERVRLYGGTLRADRQSDGSFLVDAVLPTRS